MSFTEAPLVFQVGSDTLVGVLAAPAGQAQATAVLVVVGGPQVRAGSHRHFVQLSRHLAAHGHAALRFDVRGMGDSSGAPAGFEHQHDDIAAAIGELQASRPEVRRVVLWGLCDGASAALLYVQRTRDPRIAGLVLLNPWVRSPQTLARATLSHYYTQRMLQPGFWRKLLGGSVGLAAVRGWWHNVRTASRFIGGSGAAEGAPFAERMAQGWRSFGGPILLLLSGDDVTAHEFAGHAASHPSWRGALAMTQLSRIELPGADHTFSGTEPGRRVIELTLDWLRTRWPQGAAPETPAGRT